MAVIYLLTFHDPSGRTLSADELCFPSDVRAVVHAAKLLREHADRASVQISAGDRSVERLLRTELGLGALRRVVSSKP